MSNTIKLKRGTSTPSVSDISNGEVAIDTQNKKLYINDSGTVKEIGGSGTIGGASGLDFNDNVKVRFGTGNDLEIYHDGSNSFVSDTGTGGLKVLGSDIYLKNPADADMIRASSGGAVELYYDGAIKLTTEGTAVKVFGLFVPSTNDSYHLGIDSLRWQNLYISNDIDILDNGKLLLGAGDDLQIYHDGTHSRIVDHGSNATSFQTGELRIHDLAANEYIAKFVANGAVDLYYDNSAKLETTSYGVFVSGTFRADVIDMQDNKKANWGNDDDLEIYHSGSHSFIDNSTGVLHVCGDDVRIKGNGDSETLAKFVKNGAVELFYNDSLRLSTASGGVSFTNGHLSGGDNNYLILGTGNDLQIYHDGTHSYINDTGTGNLKIKSNKTAIQSTAGEDCIVANENGAVELYYDDVKHLETYSLGVRTNNKSVFINGDTGKFVCGAGSDLQIWHDGSGSQINNSTGYLVIQSDDLRLRDKANGHPYLKAVADGAVELYYDNSKKFETTSGGVKVVGTEGGNANLELHADEGDDNADKWLIQSAHVGNGLTIQSYASGSWQSVLKATDARTIELHYQGSKKFSTNANGCSTHGHHYFDDNQKILLGSGSDMEIYHNGNHSKIRDVGTGNLYIESVDGNIYLRVNDNEQGVTLVENGAVELYCDNSKKVATVSDGIELWGDIHLPDSTGAAGVGELTCGAGQDLRIYHDGNHNYIDSSNGNVYIRSAGGENMGIFEADGGVNLYYNNSKKCQTTTWGFELFGNIHGDDNIQLNLGTSNDLQLYHNGTDSIIGNGTGTLQILSPSQMRFRASSFQFISYGNDETMATFTDDGAVELYYDNAKKLETTSTGIQVGNYSGNPTISLAATQDGPSRLNFYDNNSTEGIVLRAEGATSGGQLVFCNKWNTETDRAVFDAGTNPNFTLYDNVKLQLGTGGDLKIYHDGNDSWIENTTGALYLKSPYFIDLRGNGNETMIKGVVDGAVELYYNNSKKFETLSGGAQVTGGLTITGQTYLKSELNLTVQGNKYIDTAHLNHALRFRRISDGDTGHSDHCTVSSAGLWSADFNDVSDEKLKENIVAIADGAISKIKQLRPVNFDWKDTDKAKNVSGFIAQEIKTILPNLVYGTEYDPTIIDQSQGIKSTGYSVNTIGIVANLTKALQEAITKIETLETKVAALESA